MTLNYNTKPIMAVESPQWMLLLAGGRIRARILTSIASEKKKSATKYRRSERHHYNGTRGGWL